MAGAGVDSMAWEEHISNVAPLHQDGGQ